MWERETNTVLLGGQSLMKTGAHWLTVSVTHWTREREIERAMATLESFRLLSSSSVISPTTVCQKKNVRWSSVRSLASCGIFRRVGLQESSQRRHWTHASLRTQASSTALVAKELERVAAKECLLLSIKDAGGLQGLADAKADEQARIDVNEKILVLERINPTPRPTTSPLLDGLWGFQFAGAQSPGLIAAQTLLKGVPPSLASVTSLTLLIADGIAKATGNLKIVNTVESSFSVTSKIEVEGPSRLKEEYIEGLLSTPTVPEGTIPSQLKGLVDQIFAAVNQFPDAVKDVVSGGIKLPLTNTFSRELIISYLDEEVMIARDKSGIPDVLVRIDISVAEVFLNT